jgi:quercetin dioxygenase-like cupin family protein
MKIIRNKETIIEDRGGYLVKKLHVGEFREKLEDAVFFETSINVGGKFKEQWHKKSSECIIFLSDGLAIVDGVKHECKKGDLLWIEPGEKHKFVAAEEDLKMIAIRFPNLPDDKFT